MKTKRKKNKNQQLSFVDNFRYKNKKSITKRLLRADGLSLLPSALRPRLVGGSSTKSTSFSLVAVVVFSLAFSFFLQTSYANNVSAASLTLTIPSTPLSLDISPIKESNFQESTASKISVKTDSESGYTLSIKSKNNNDYDKLVNGTNKLDSISSVLSESDYQNTGALNTWSWLPSKLNGENNSNFLPSPKNSEETILDITEDKNDTSANTYDITLAAKTNQTIAPGNYTNTFVITCITNEKPVPETMQEFGDYCDKMEEVKLSLLWILEIVMNTPLPNLRIVSAG